LSGKKVRKMMKTNKSAVETAVTHRAEDSPLGAVWSIRNEIRASGPLLLHEDDEPSEPAKRFPFVLLANRTLKRIWRSLRNT
jgi:hypothetical protein